MSTTLNSNYQLTIFTCTGSGYWQPQLGHVRGRKEPLSTREQLGQQFHLEQQQVDEPSVNDVWLRLLPKLITTYDGLMATTYA